MARKILGILGGMGPEATDALYQKIIKYTNVTKDQEHIDILIYSHASIPDRTSYILNGKAEELWQVFVKDIKVLKAAGCDLLVVPCNTSHYFQDRFYQEFGDGFLSLIDETAKYSVENVGKKIGVLATDGTVNSDIYGQALRKFGGEAIYPDADYQAKIMSIIYDEIKKGEKGSLHTMFAIIKHMRDKGCDGMILGCTELSVMKDNHPQLNKRRIVDALDVISKVVIEECGGDYQGNL